MGESIGSGECCSVVTLTHGNVVYCLPETVRMKGTKQGFVGD